MKIIYLEANDNIRKNDLCICLGFFDGMHQAHTALIKQAVKIGHRKGLEVAMFTFNMNVLNFIKKQELQCLTSIEDKARLAENLGVDLMYVMTVSEELIHMTAEAFIDRFLIHAKQIIAGEDFRFGYQNTGDIKLLLKNGNFETTVVPEITYHGEKISSSSIRKALLAGDIKLANFLLGRPYRIKGKVVEGRKIGRKLGFPTANTSYFPYLLPKAGVYYTKVKLEGEIYNGVTNIGSNPTYGNRDTTVETYIIGLNRYLYDLDLEISFIKYIRAEAKFAKEADLIKKIYEDIEIAKSFIEMEKTNEKNQ